MEKQEVQASLAKETKFGHSTFTQAMKNIALAILLLGSQLAICQREWDAKPFSFGVSVGAEFQTLNLALLPERPGAPYVHVPHPTGSGAGLGIWGQWPLLPRFYMRPACQFSYTANSLEFESADGQRSRNRFAFADLELPLHFILADQFKHLPVKGLILFGGRVSWNMAAGSTSADLRFLPERIGLDIGIGAGFEWGKWGIQPELVYSYGLNNSHDFHNSPYDWAVGRVVRDRLSLRVLLELD